MLRLNLGAGGQTIQGWENVDRGLPEGLDRGFREGELCLDIVDDDWPWDDGSVDGIVIHHVLDLLDPVDSLHVMRECYRVLRPGGAVRVSCADIGLAIRRAQAGDQAWFPEPQWCGDGLKPDLDKTLGFYITQGGARKQNYTFERLQSDVGRAGFRICVEQPFGSSSVGLADLDSRPGESWFAEAQK